MSITPSFRYNNAKSPNEPVQPHPEKIISYINVDSSQRNRTSTNKYGQMYTLPPYPLEFTNGSSIVKVSFPDHTFNENDQIVLDNVVSKYSILHNVIQIKKNSNFIRIHHPNHGLSLYGKYNSSDPLQFIATNYIDNLPSSFNETDNIPDTMQYYILKENSKIDLTIQISKAMGMDFSRTMIGNVPVNYINKKHRVYLIFKKNSNFVHDPDYYLIKLEKPASVNYADSKNFIKDHHGNPTKTLSTNIIHIGFHNLFGVPLKYLNSGTITNDNTGHPYLVIQSTTNNKFSVDIGYPAIVDPNFKFYDFADIDSDGTDSTTIINSNSGGGPQVFVRPIVETTIGYPNPNQYIYNLDKTYKNVIQAKIVSSIFPNSQRIINNDITDVNNNKIYWRNLDDGDYIYYIEITPGNYSTLELSNAIKQEFENTIRYPYSVEYQAGIDQTVGQPLLISYPTPLNTLKYDENGLYKYHIVDVEISENTDIVSLSTFREIMLHDSIGIGPISHRVLIIPDNDIELTMADNLQLDMGVNGTNIVPFEFVAFNPKNEELFIYFTPNTQTHVSESYPYAYHNLYQFLQNMPNGPGISGFNTFVAGLNNDRQILVNFYRTKGVFPDITSYQEMNSINTQTRLQNFYYDYLTNIVTMVNHKIKPGALIITDQFNGLVEQNQIFVYEVKNIIGDDKFSVIKIAPGTKYKFIYDSLIINFSANSNDTIYWLDQITKEEPILQLSPPFTDNNNTLSVKMINIPTTAPDTNIKIIKRNILKVNHPNHQLKVNDDIRISGSGPINRVPSDIINGKHTIFKIIDNNSYVILLDKHVANAAPVPFEHVNSVIIRYPDVFQLFFNYPDTMGHILNFPRVGENNSVTRYDHIVKNINPYINDYSNQKIVPQKLNISGPTYFYISIVELGNHHNTKPVSHVFAIGRWIDEPGTVVFDSVVPTPRIFNPVLPSLSQLSISIFHPNGKLVEFNGLDHQFTLEIIEDRNSIN